MSSLLWIIAIAESAAVSAFIFWRFLNIGRESLAINKHLKEELDIKRELWGRIESIQGELADPAEYEKTVADLSQSRETLKTERGRVIITQAELESIEVRLRELDEVNRELEASTIETKEDLKIFQKREGELKNKNQDLRTQIATSTSKMEALISEIQMSVQMQEQVKVMRADLLRCEEQVETLINEIQKGNEQYFIAKRRYDALDVEYAQLYQQYQEQKKR